MIFTVATSDLLHMSQTFSSRISKEKCLLRCRKPQTFASLKASRTNSMENFSMLEPSEISRIWLGGWTSGRKENKLSTAVKPKCYFYMTLVNVFTLHRKGRESVCQSEPLKQLKMDICCVRKRSVYHPSSAANDESPDMTSFFHFTPSVRWAAFGIQSHAGLFDHKNRGCIVLLDPSQ